jgi:N-acetylglucosamine-6-sulfatase
VPAGAVIDQLVSQVDLAPTFAGWAEAATPSFVDGRPLDPLLREPESPGPWRRSVLVEHHLHRRGGEEKSPPFQALRGEDVVYVEYQPPPPRRCKRPGAKRCANQEPSAPLPPPERELYDLLSDRRQLQNLAAIADSSTLESLSATLASLSSCSGASCRAAEDAALPEPLLPPV